MHIQQGYEQVTKTPRFKSEDEEAKWSSPKGRDVLKRQAAAPDLDKAREIAERKGIGYQTLLKTLVHEGLRRESRRQ